MCPSFEEADPTGNGRSDYVGKLEDPLHLATFPKDVNNDSFVQRYLYLLQVVSPAQRLLLRIKNKDVLDSLNASLSRYGFFFLSPNLFICYYSDNPIL